MRSTDWLLAGGVLVVQDVEFRQLRDPFLGQAELRGEICVVVRGNGEKLHAVGAQPFGRPEDIVGGERDVLHAGTGIGMQEAGSQRLGRG